MQGMMIRTKRRWQRQTAAKRDLIRITVLSIISWLAIFLTDSCRALFQWIYDHEEYEIDSFILAYFITACAVSAFAVRRYRDLRDEVRAREQAEQRAHMLAYHDPLTGLGHRRALQEHLEQATSGSHDGPPHLALIMLHLDRFKAIRNLHGREAGDRLLLTTAERISHELGARSKGYRLAGSEFAVVMPVADAGDDRPARFTRRLLQSLGEPFEDVGIAHHVGASAGIALYPTDASDASALMRASDIALYRARSAGPGQHRFYEAGMDEQIRLRAKLEQEIRFGIVSGEFCPYYQPLIDLQTGAKVGFELLARWERPDGAYIGPDQFIPIAEEAGLINEMMLSLLSRACVDARDWDPQLTIALNISPIQLQAPWLSQKILAVLARHGFAPSRLAIEITENAIIENEENARYLLESFKNQGMQISLDDFGTGYASLHHLRMLPFDKIKIDRSFVLAMEHDAEAYKIVAAIAGLANSLDLPVVAEGVEDSATAVKLRDLGCTQGQGYYFGRPSSANVVNQERLEQLRADKRRNASNAQVQQAGAHGEDIRHRA